MATESQIALYENFKAINTIETASYDQFDVKRGLRNADGTGVIAGLTNIANVHGYVVSDGEKVADEGMLRYRGYDVYDLLDTSVADRRFNFEEVAYLLLMGELPTQEQLDRFIAALDAERELPDGFTASMIMRDTPPDIMNMLQRTILLLYAYDADAEDRSAHHEIHTAISLISRLPRIMVLTYYAKQARFNNGSMIMHRFIPGQSTAETILSMLRPDRQFTAEEARMLDIMLCLHAEHGGGNNSTFTTRVLTSSDTDPYSTYAGAIGSLKGWKHGGANHQVLAMQKELKENVADWSDEGQVADYLAKIVNKEAFDNTGLVYGMGHAVYTKSDPRAIICKQFAEKLAVGTEFEAEYRLLESIERRCSTCRRPPCVNSTVRSVSCSISVFSISPRMYCSVMGFVAMLLRVVASAAVREREGAARNQHDGRARGRRRRASPRARDALRRASDHFRRRALDGSR